MHISPIFLTSGYFHWKVTDLRDLVSYEYVNSMPCDDDFLSFLTNQLLIPKQLLFAKSGIEVYALVNDEWINQLCSGSCLTRWEVPDDVSEVLLSARLSNNAAILQNYKKIKILQFSQDQCVKKKKLKSTAAASFGHLLDLVAKQSFFLNWKASSLKYSDSYTEENYPSIDSSHIDSLNSHRLKALNAVSFDNENNNLLNKDLESSSIKVSSGINHANILPVLAEIKTNNRLCIVKQCIEHNICDCLMYSPSNLTNIKAMFVLFQLVKALNHICLNYPEVCFNSLSWKNVKVDELLWIQADIDVFKRVSSKSGDHRSNEHKSNPQDSTPVLALKEEFTDLWVCGRISNYDYLMHLNKLAGKRLNDPNHHPILPWVSDLSVSDGGWRDFAKSKYRLNKGDDQLQLQYAMATSTEHGHVPYHVSDMLSDITYYVYKARVIPKTTLQKHVRAYWEPNEYPSTVQRMQEWTPDECIPEFFTDPSIFKSHHEDMINLGVPDWCDSPEDFVRKHMSMLESDYVSQHLHDWIDITFGYKLSGKYAVQSLNVCRQLVDQHSHLTTHGIVQLFDSPHPQKRLSTVHRPEKVLLSIKSFLKSSNHEKTTNGDSATDSESKDVSKEEESDDFSVKADRKIVLPSDFKPFSNLNHLEKLLNFQASQMNRHDISAELEKTLHYNMKRLAQCSLENFTADCNMLVLMCMMIELFTQPHPNYIDDDMLLSDRFQKASLYFESNKHQFPIALKNALEYLFKALSNAPKRVVEDLRKCEVGAKNGGSVLPVKIFKWLNNSNFSSPCPLHLLTESMQILHFPVYFEALHCFLSEILLLTNYYEEPLSEQHYDAVKEDLLSLLKKLRNNNEGMEFLLPHIRRLLNQPLPHAASFLFLIFDHISQVLGPESTTKKLLPTIVAIYNKVNERAFCETYDFDIVKSTVQTLFDKYFLVQLLSRLGLQIFLESLSRPIADCLVVNVTCSGIVVVSVHWLLNILGPTLSSKYVIRNLLHVLNTCYSNKVIEDDESSSTNDELVLSCLVHAATLYGQSFLTLQYIPHISFSVSSSISGTCFTQQSYATLLASTSLLITIIPYLSDHGLMEELHKMSKEIIMPLIGVISSKRLRFPGGAEQRKYLCIQTITLLQKIAFRIGREMSRKHLTNLLQSFFSNFSIHNNIDTDNEYHAQDDSYFDMELDDVILIPSSLEPETDTIAAAVRFSETGDSQSEQQGSETSIKNVKRHFSVADAKLAEEINSELSSTFCPETAYLSYVPFARLMGQMHLEQILKENESVVWRLSSRVSVASKCLKETNARENSNSTPTISMVGNQIVVEDKQDNDVFTCQHLEKKGPGDEEGHLKGNWLAYWEHEIGLAPDDDHIHFNQIELQAFQGHNSAVKSLYVNNTEEWFLSSSKDKTVKIWSLTGSNSSSLFVYRQHKKSVFYSSMIEANFTVVSCDGSVHLWDPFTGKTLQTFESNDFRSNVSAISAMPAPHPQVLAATGDSYLRMIDARMNILAQEYKSTIGTSVGMIKSLCTGQNWAAVGFGTGVIAIIDLRMGPILRMWQAHDNEVLSLSPVSHDHFLTSSVDQTIAYWDTGYQKPIMVYRAVSEAMQPVRSFHNEALSATSNKFVVYTLPGRDFSSDNTAMKAALDKPLLTKLRSDILKGGLSTFAVLPMKRQLLFASDSGSVKLLA